MKMIIIVSKATALSTYYLLVLAPQLKNKTRKTMALSDSDIDLSLKATTQSKATARAGKKAAPPRRPRTLLKHRADLERRRKAKEQKAATVLRGKKQAAARRKNDKATMRAEKPANIKRPRPASTNLGTAEELDESASSSSVYTSSSEASEFSEVVTKPPQKKAKKALLISKESINDSSLTNSEIPKTEVLFPAQILKEEVETYIEQVTTLRDAEKSFLRDWYMQVQTELQKMNQHVADNFQLAKQLRQVNRQRNRNQDLLLQQKRKLQALKNETAAYEQEVHTVQNKHSTVVSANQFLRALKGLAKQTTLVTK